MPEEKRFRKGFFGRAVLPATLTYLNPESRNRLLALGGGAALALALSLAVGIWLTGGGLVSSGPLSSRHSGLESDCGGCHEAFQTVSDRKCLNCHRRPGQPGVHTVSAHVAQGSPGSQEGEGGTLCFACHPEHRGRDAAPVSTGDERCAFCHPFRPFRSAHPEFSFRADGRQPVAAPTFFHLPHLQAVQTETRIDALSEACIVCHNLRPDGQSFAPIDFEAHCEACHSESAEQRAYDGSGGKVQRRDGFDHGAHSIQSACVDCHGAIQFQEKARRELRAAGGNLPGIAICRQCHDRGLASDRCTLCHRFHPSPTAPNSTG